VDNEISIYYDTLARAQGTVEITLDSRKRSRNNWSRIDNKQYVIILCWHCVNLLTGVLTGVLLPAWARSTLRKERSLEEEEVASNALGNYKLSFRGLHMSPRPLAPYMRRILSRLFALRISSILKSFSQWFLWQFCHNIAHPKCPHTTHSMYPQQHPTIPVRLYHQYQQQYACSTVPNNYCWWSCAKWDLLIWTTLE
jgi:hypothetical protein